MSTAQTIEQQYARQDLTTTILTALEAQGKDSAGLVPADLAAVDEFHIRGVEATREMMALAAFTSRDHVLDVGSGIGGPSRTLAEQVGCRVTGVDLTPAYCDTATELAAIMGLSDRVQYVQGDALFLPFPHGSFDGVWTQHVTMNIPDKARLLKECRRVLKPGGRLAMYEIIADGRGDLHYPVPWADDPSISFLEGELAMKRHLWRAGFEVATWRDVTAPSQAWFRHMVDAPAPSPLGLHVLVGPTMRTKAINVLRNLEEGRLRVVQALCV